MLCLKFQRITRIKRRLLWSLWEPVARQWSEVASLMMNKN